MLFPGLSSVEDTECIVAKAIRDGGIDAEIDHEQGWVTSRASPDIYTTAEPQADFHERIAFCLDLHNEVRASSLIALHSCLPACWSANHMHPAGLQNSMSIWQILLCSCQRSGLQAPQQLAAVPATLVRLRLQAVKAMRFEPNTQQKPSLENADTARERVKLEEEAAKAAAEDDADF